MSDQLHVCFVCTGNICRSPMAQNIFRSAIDDAGLSDRVRVTSRGTSSWHVGEPADNRARTELLAHGYSDAHTAAHLAPDDFDADLLVAMDSGHAKDLERKRLGARVRLLRDTGNTLCDPATTSTSPTRTTGHRETSRSPVNRSRRPFRACWPGSTIAWAAVSRRGVEQRPAQPTSAGTSVPLSHACAANLPPTWVDCPGRGGRGIRGAVFFHPRSVAAG